MKKFTRRFAVALVAGVALFAVGCRSTCCHDARITTAELYDVVVEGATTGTTGHAMTVHCVCAMSSMSRWRCVCA